MRVLHLTRDYPPRINGGISNAVGGWVRATPSLAHAVISFDAYRPTRSTVTCDLRESEATARVGEPAVLRIGAPSQLDVARAFARRQTPDVIHVHHAMLWSLARELTSPRVYTVHVDHREQERLRDVDDATASRLAEDEALAEADRVLVPSPALFARFLARVPPQRLRLAPFVTPLPSVSEDERSGEPTVLYAGRFSDVKGTAELFAAIPSVVAATGAHIVVAGGLPDSPKRDRRWRRRLRDAVDADTLAHVDLTGWLDPETLSTQMRRAWLLVAPSWTETFGLAIVEAMAHGLPIVGTRVDAIAHLVRHQHEGLLSPPRDVAALSRHIIALLGDAPLRTRMAAAARLRAAEYAAADGAAALEAVYRELTDG